MGDINQIHYLRKHLPRVDGPIIEVGSKDYGSTSSFRETYRDVEYIGVDLDAGKGVDVVADLTQGTGSLPLGHFALGICCSVMEHVRRPWLMAQSITTLIRPGGHLYISVPWVWRYHPYPDDYFRISWRGVIELFPQFDWESNKMFYSTNVPGDFHAIDPLNPGVDNSLSMNAETPAGRRKYLPYLMVNMLGTRR